MACAAALFVVLGATAAVAKPITKVVYAGPPPILRQIAPKYVSRSFVRTYQPDINAFFNHRTTINVGDTVSFRLQGFHTVDLPGSSGTDLPLILPGATLGNVLDAAGNPFWFSNKLPSLGFNPMLFSRSHKLTYNGRRRIDSGLPVAPPLFKPLNVRFTKAGVYKFFCDVHPGMVGFIVVKPKGAAIPSAAQDKATLTAQAIRAIKAAKRAARAKVPADTISVGKSAPGGVELFNMFPATLTVPAGTHVTFKMSRFSRETHTASFGPIPYLMSLSKSFQGPVPSPIAIYPSDMSLTESLTSHGNGFASTGALDNDPTTPQPSSTTIDFTQPGTYHFMCLIHPFMRGTIIVK